MEFVKENLLTDVDLTPHPLGAKVQQWATSRPELEGSTTTLGMRRDIIDDMLYCANDDIHDLRYGWAILILTFLQRSLLEQ